MTHTDPTTVIDLTATVAVLQIGDRQIPAALVRELDDVPFEQLDVFGRITTDTPGLTFIGRHRTTGALATSTVARRHFRTAEGWDAWRASVAPGYRLIALSKVR